MEGAAVAKFYLKRLGSETTILRLVSAGRAATQTRIALFSGNRKTNKLATLMEVNVVFLEDQRVQTKITDFFLRCNLSDHENQKRFWRDPLINLYLQRPRIWNVTYANESIVVRLFQRELTRMRERGELE